MQGRYGNDELNTSLLVLSLASYVVAMFVYYPYWLSLVFRLVGLALLGWMIFRMLSRNIYGRAAENRKIKPAYDAVTGWFKLTYKKFRDGRTHRYYKCPACKAQLRVKNVKGLHTIRCPKCGKTFEKKIR